MSHQRKHQYWQENYYRPKLHSQSRNSKWTPSRYSSDLFSSKSLKTGPINYWNGRTGPQLLWDDKINYT